jgi:hypothetical protein
MHGTATAASLQSLIPPMSVKRSGDRRVYLGIHHGAEDEIGSTSHLG